MEPKEKCRLDKAAYNWLEGRVWPDGSFLCNFQLDLTLACNGRCKDCMKMLDVLPYTDPDPHVTERDVEVAAILLRRYRIRVRRIRVSGGEPLLHPRFKDMCKLIKEEWDPGVMRIFTNDTKGQPKQGRGTTYRTISIADKVGEHRPQLISPADLGVSSRQNYAGCGIRSSCGRCFDTYGFACCGQASVLERVLGVDTHSAYPVLQAVPELCRHCIFSLGRRSQRRLWNAVWNGEIEYPTKTYREGIKRERNAPLERKRFLERLSEHERIPKG